MRNSFEGPSGYTGGSLEDELISGIDCEWNGRQYIAALDRGDRPAANAMVDEWAQKHLSEEAFSEWDKASSKRRMKLIMEWASKNQPKRWNPRDPRYIELDGDKTTKENMFAGDFHDTVAMKMGLENYNDLELITTAGTPVDTKWRTDCYWKYKKHIKTMDITLRDKQGSSVADYVARFKDPGSKEELDRVSEDFANRFLESIRLEEEMEARRRVA